MSINIQVIPMLGKISTNNNHRTQIRSALTTMTPGDSNGRPHYCVILPLNQVIAVVTRNSRYPDFRNSRPKPHASPHSFFPS